MGEKAHAAAAHTNSFSYVLDEAAKEAKASVARTPMLLEKHREAGVVDAGGQGLFVIMDGMRRYTEGEDLELSEVEGASAIASSSTGHAQVEHGEYGYCTNFIVVGGGWRFDDVRSHLAGMGDSAVIVGDDKIVKVHIHTEAPGSVLEYATKLGSLRQISITTCKSNTTTLSRCMAANRRMERRTARAATCMVPVGQWIAPINATGRIAVLAVASGAGMTDFPSMGATAIIEGGQTMNPARSSCSR